MKYIRFKNAAHPEGCLGQQVDEVEIDQVGVLINRVA